MDIQSMIQTVNEYWNIIYDFFNEYTDFCLENRII